MKSSTIRRSTLSKETMEVIENLAKEKESDEFPGEYIRHDEQAEVSDCKAQEIDLLWQTFKNTQFNSKSPTAYILWGFFGGIASTLVVLGLVGVITIKSGRADSITKMIIPNIIQEQTLEQRADMAQNEVENRVNVPSDDENIKNNQIVSPETPSESGSIRYDINPAKTEKYIVKSGDTGESIIKHYYGSYSPEKAELIMKANNLKSLDIINIDQELLIPVKE